MNLILNEPCGVDAFFEGGGKGSAQVVADRISEQLRNPSQLKRPDGSNGGYPVSIIGLNGCWGCGKSNVIELVRQNFSGSKDQANFVFFEYDLWGRYCPCDQFAEYWLDRVLRHELSSIFHGCPGCLYTGDISLDEADLTRAFEKYVRNIGMVQLPHHGSLDSFGTGDLPINGRVCVATYGEKNRFGHPAFAVKRAVAEKGGLWVDVTETDESRFRVEYTV